MTVAALDFRDIFKLLLLSDSPEYKDYSFTIINNFKNSKSSLNLQAQQKQQIAGYHKI